MADGLFVKRLKAFKPHTPTIVFVRPDDPMQEIAARSLGVSAVLSEDASDELFRETLANVLGLRSVVSLKTASAPK